MPLNPNGKIDKPALPFPDTAQLAPAAESRREGPSTTPTEEAMRTIWARVLPNAPSPIPVDENFFDLGGHSILATRLIFEIRKTFVVDAPLGLVFDKPTIKDLAAAIDSLRNADLGFAEKPDSNAAEGAATANGVAAPGRVEYGQDYEALLEKLQPSYTSIPADYSEHPLTVFLTGATGFLGAFILRDLLRDESRVKKVICLVRAKSSELALERLRDAASGRGVWDEKWVESSRLEVVKGDLDLPKFGLDESAWDRVAAEADAIIHNGALVRACIDYTRLHNTHKSPLGSLGVSVREASCRQRFGHAHRCRLSCDWQTQVLRIRVVDFRDRHGTLRSVVRYTVERPERPRRCTRKR